MLAGASQADPVLQAEVDGQARQIAALQRLSASLHERQAETASQVEQREAVRRQIARLDERVLELRQQVAEVEAGLNALADDFFAYRTEYRKSVRIAAVGEEYSTLVAANGKTYKDVVVRRVTDAGLEVTHSAGPTRLRHNELPAELRDRFQWDAGEAAALLAQEATSQHERERLYALASAQAREKRAEAARKSERELADARIARLERQLAAVQSSVSTSQLGSAGSLGERRAVGSRSTRYRYRDNGYDYRSRPTIYYYNTGQPAARVVPRVTLSRPAIRHQPSAVRSVRAAVPTFRRPSRTPTPPLRRCPGGTD